MQELKKGRGWKSGLVRAVALSLSLGSAGCGVEAPAEQRPEEVAESQAPALATFSCPTTRATVDRVDGNTNYRAAGCSRRFRGMDIQKETRCTARGLRLVRQSMYHPANLASPSMPLIENATSLATRDFLSIDKDGADTLVVCVSGSFQLPAPGRPASSEPVLTDEQPSPSPEDVYWGEPGTSSLRYEGQSAWFRPGTDIYVNGQAWAPGGRPVKELLVAVRVGPCRKGIQVLGERLWQRGLTGWHASSARPFESMPLRYERSFGGPAVKAGARPGAYEERNLVGRGYHPEGRDAADQLLPNLEDPLHRLSSPSERVTPVGLGPISRAWQPRLGFGGTYDAKWVEQRAPLWPRDFDVRFFQAAAPGLVATPWLVGGEEVVLSGLSPDGAFSFHLPRRRLVAKAVFRNCVERRRLVLDAVLLEPDERRLRLFWRTAFRAQGALALHEYTLVRELESWEEA